MHGRWLVLTACTLVAGAAVGYVGVCVYAASRLSTTGAHLPLTATAESIGPDWEDVAFPSRVDGVKLRGWLFHAGDGRGRSVILLHGFTANRTDAGVGEPEIAQRFLAAGYDVLMFDFRTFGQSGGDHFTIGWREGRDVLGAHDYMLARGYDPARMAIVGLSMGGEAMLGVAEQLGDVGALVSDSAYADLRPVLDRNITEYSGLPRLFNAGIVAAFQLFFDANPNFRPVDHVGAVPGRAFLFLHGGHDDFVVPDNARRLFAASGNPESELVIFEGSEHTQGFHDQPDHWLAVVLGFIDRQIGERAAA